jgi:hypothetical protein
LQQANSQSAHFYGIYVYERLLLLLPLLLKQYFLLNLYTCYDLAESVGGRSLAETAG